MSYLDQITVGSTTYDIQDSNAGASLAIDGSTLSLKNKNNSTLSTVTLSGSLPAVSSSDDGKILGVDSGVWSVVDNETGIYYGNTEPSDPGVNVWIDPTSTADGGGLPSGGITNSFLIKTANTDFTVGWSSTLQPAGEIILTNNVHYYASTSALPSPGVPGRIAFVRV